MLVIRGTKKFRERVGRRVVESPSTGLLGAWYANVLFWRPQVAMFVSERALLPVFVPLAPAKSVVDRFPAQFATVARLLGADDSRLELQLKMMEEWVLTKTESRSVLGTMNEFGHMADNYRWMHDEVDLIELAVWLSDTPCRVTSGDAVWPNAEVRALLA